ncbi:hypothetical protein [Natrarchaeobaculum aegyptiacum]|uniref:Transcriptional regulator n=1 Tax=Natrarchaeobaculum aegyptiacum TaxID=745377 RepID=A0A2Z2HQ64_9EURY|nr:hypothetical protein [Natrarchaeobaculum aegyptiacum]ARS89149.1 hypothetical protein B1756_04860 [Natrarchaeobaculum aegyptiacum]
MNKDSPGGSTASTERWNTVFRAAAAEPRRQLVVSLLDAPPGTSVSLPESAINPDVPQDPQTLRQELYHEHLPLLSDGGFVEWETDPLEASRGPNFDQIGVVFDTLHEHAPELPDSLVVGCLRLEVEEQQRLDY